MHRGPSAGQIGASASVTLALAAVAVHTVAMLAVGSVLAIGVCGSFGTIGGWLGSRSAEGAARTALK